LDRGPKFLSIPEICADAPTARAASLIWRYWRIEDGKLFIETAPAPSPNFSGNARWRLPPRSATGHHRHEYDYVVVPMTGGVAAGDDASQ